MTDRPTADGLPLATLLSQALVAFTIEFDNEFEHRMPHRTTSGPPRPVERHRYLVVAPAGDGRTKLARLTPKGGEAQGDHRRLLAAIDARGRERFGGEEIADLRRMLQRAPLGQCLEPYADGWRAHVRAPDTLPHYPMVLHRGGFPDGS